MHLLRFVTLASLIGLAVPTAIATHPSSAALSPLRSNSYVIKMQQPKVFRILLSLEPSDKPIVQTEDWTTKDVKLPWNQVALDKSFGAEELVVFTKSFKFKLGFVSNRKERVHARWTQKSVEVFIMRGRDCGIVFGCESSTSYGLPKRIKVTVGGQDFFLKTIEQNTYELTPEFKQALQQTSGRFTFKVDERVNFEIQEEAIPGLKQLFAIAGNTSSANPSSIPPANSAPPPSVPNPAVF
jgi:hypothetical protein